MTAAPLPAPPPPAPVACQLCGVPLGPSDLRCPECGLYQQLGPDRPNPFVGRAVWLLAAALVALWVVVLLVVLAAR